MVLVINQDTFDDAVKENINEFGMEVQEAISEAVKQFEAQGVDLSNVIKDNVLLSEADGTHELKNVLSKLNDSTNSENSLPINELQEQLAIIRRECDKGIPYRVFAGKNGAYNILMNLLKANKQDTVVTKECLATLTSLMTKQPDLLDDSGVQIIVNFLNQTEDIEVQKLLLKWVKECCIMHEANRQKIFQVNVLDHLKVLLENADSGLIRDVLGVLRALVLDDDVRVEFGKSHEHARIIGTDTLSCITGLLTEFKTDELLINDILSTISALLVRTEFCKKVEDAGVLDTIKQAILVFQSKDKLMRQCFKVLKALARNDEVKIHVIQNGLAPLVVSTLNYHKSSSSTVILGLGCIAALTLRCAENSSAFFEAEAPEAIYNCMIIHREDASVQKTASWAIRNMVSRSRYQSDKFLDLGVESLLKDNLKKFVNHEFDIKSALRDLGCDVNLKEEWTGIGGLLTTQYKKK